jgi:hypothetical protein
MICGRVAGPWPCGCHSRTAEVLAGAKLDRLTHRVHILEANGPSYRLAEAKRRLKAPGGKAKPGG